MTEPTLRDFLGGDSSIGGRTTDFEQVGYTLIGKLKDFYPPNEIPQDLLDAVYSILQNGMKLRNEVETFLRRFPK